MAHSRFNEDGSPKTLIAFLESSGQDLFFQFRYKRSSYEPLENEFDRRVQGRKKKFEMIRGKFMAANDDIPVPLSQGRFRLSPLYLIELNSDIVLLQRWCSSCLPGVCTHTETEGKQRKCPTWA